MWASSGTTNTFPRSEKHNNSKIIKCVGMNSAQPLVIVYTCPKAEYVVRSRICYDFMILPVHLLSCGIEGQEKSQPYGY